MNYYFFPQIDNLKSSVTLVNFPCLDHFPLRAEIQKIYATWTDGSKWHYLHIGDIKPNEAVEVKLEDLPTSVPRELHPFLFFHYDLLPAVSEKLFLSDHMYFMPTWRGNIKIYNEFTSTSYEGDYQHEMVKYIKKGSLCSLSPMIQASPNLVNKFILVNLREDPKIETHSLRFVDPIKSEILYESNVSNNRCNVIDISEVDFSNNTIALVVCGTMVGIPVFFSMTNDCKSMSFEHTHPPSSMVVFGEPNNYQKNLKSYWLEKFAA